jgi:hypothetical protein
MAIEERLRMLHKAFRHYGIICSIIPIPSQVGLLEHYDSAGCLGLRQAKRMIHSVRVFTTYEAKRMIHAVKLHLSNSGTCGKKERRIHSVTEYPEACH